MKKAAIILLVTNIISLLFIYLLVSNNSVQSNELLISKGRTEELEKQLYLKDSCINSIKDSLKISLFQLDSTKHHPKIVIIKTHEKSNTIANLNSSDGVKLFSNNLSKVKRIR